MFLAAFLPAVMRCTHPRRPLPISPLVVQRHGRRTTPGAAADPFIRLRISSWAWPWGGRPSLIRACQLLLKLWLRRILGLVPRHNLRDNHNSNLSIPNPHAPTFAGMRVGTLRLVRIGVSRIPMP